MNESQMKIDFVYNSFNVLELGFVAGVDLMVLM